MRPSQVCRQIEVECRLAADPLVEGLGGFTPRLPVLVGLQCTLDDVGDRAIFTSRQTMGEVSRARTADG